MSLFSHSGGSLFEQGNYPKALDNHLKALKIDEELNKTELHTTSVTLELYILLKQLQKR